MSEGRAVVLVGSVAVRRDEVDVRGGRDVRRGPRRARAKGWHVSSGSGVGPKVVNGRGWSAGW
eukprot:9026196-Pyramimonas_sp.AAC.1